MKRYVEEQKRLDNYEPDDVVVFVWGRLDPDDPGTGVARRSEVKQGWVPSGVGGGGLLSG